MSGDFDTPRRGCGNRTCFCTGECMKPPIDQFWGSVEELLRYKPVPMIIRDGWFCPRCKTINNPDNKTCANASCVSMGEL